jgi:spore coat protein CotF
LKKRFAQKNYQMIQELQDRHGTKSFQRLAFINEKNILNNSDGMHHFEEKKEKITLDKKVDDLLKYLVSQELVE